MGLKEEVERGGVREGEIPSDSWLSAKLTTTTQGFLENLFLFPLTPALSFSDFH